MDEITLMILKIVISVCVALFTAYVIPYLKALKDDKRYQSLYDIVMVAVQAAEQTIKGSGQGEIKRIEVIRFVSQWLTERGIKISDDEISQILEAAVWQIKQG